MEGSANSRRRKKENFEELTRKLERYEGTVVALSEQYGRMTGYGGGGGAPPQATTASPLTAFDFFNTVSLLNSDLCQVWNEAFVHLNTRIQRNTLIAKMHFIFYLLIVFISLGLAIGFVAFITVDINRSVRILKTLFKGLNENDLTLSLQINSMDEFGELMTAFNGFLHILRSTFGSFKQSAQLVSNSVFDLSSSSKQITTTANEQSSSVSEIVSTMEGSKNLSEQIAIKTTEVANLAIETQELSSKGADLREANQVMMEDIRVQNQKIISEIRNLSDMIIRISEAIRIIDGIADQTKLIAFNASLEASSSGEAGARFSVVASEIRRFADNVVESTREIKQKIEEVQGASQTLIAEANSGSKQIEIGYERMSEQKIVFEHIVDNSQNVATRSQQISNLSKQQELASSQIFTALKEISSGVKQFVIATSSTSKIADSLNGMSEELKGKVEKFRTET
jgi:methyl-accepting chemotaxis protein